MNAPKAKVEPDLLRLCFNTSDLDGKAKVGALSTTIRRRSRVPDAKCVARGYPVGTESQIIEYFDGNQRLAVAHQYQAPNGSLTASGKPDPKQMICCGVIMWTPSDP